MPSITTGTAKISHDDLIQWRKVRLQNLGPDKRQSASRTTNSYLRALKCIFSKKHLNNLRHLDLPAELPGTTLSYLPEGSKRYRSTMDPAKLVKAAGRELAHA